MASISSKQKKPRNKPPKSRPESTSAVAHPIVGDAPANFTLSSFSPDGELFASVSLAVDKHRLRIYDTSTTQSIAEHVFDSSRVSSLCWSTTAPEDDESRRKKKKRKVADDANEAKSSLQGLLLGLSDGSIVLFSPTHGKVVKTLSHATSSATILCVTVPGESSDSAYNVWTSSSDSVLRLWSLHKSELVGSWKIDDRIPYSSLSVRPIESDEGEEIQILAANHAIHLLTISPSSDSSKPKEIASFTGHASSIKSLTWANSSRFLSIADGDRFVYVWQIPESLDGPSSQGKVIASIPLDSDVRSITLSHPPTPSPSDRQTLFALSASGKGSIFPLPQELGTSGSSKSKQSVATLTPKSTVTSTVPKGTNATAAPQVVAVAFPSGQDGKVKVARLTSGVRFFFDAIEYLNSTGDFTSTVSLPSISAALGLNASSEPNGAPMTRYTESTSLKVGSGVDVGHDATMDDIQDLEGELDVDMAELSLGQRLTALKGDDATMAGAASSDDEDDSPNKTASSSKRKKTEDNVEAIVPASSLTRTLIQALHSSDAGLLETCLAHSNAALIQNTVRRLPPQLAVPLVTACVDRLGRGKRAGRGKGGGAASSAQRGTGLVRWIRTVLVVHGGHLLTMPDLVARLAGLHTTLTTRLTLQEKLLSLSGRLDMVISQIELRSSSAPAALTVPSKKKPRRKAKKYVEGQSSSDEEDMPDAGMEVESADEEGSVEDVELGGSDEEDEEDDEEDDDLEEDEEGDEDEDDEDDDDDSDAAVGKLNGFIDNEAEEFSGEDSDDESE